MTLTTKTTLLGATALTAVVLGSFDARAGGFAVREQSAVGQGMSFAGEGTSAMGMSGMFWNPAVVTTAKGLEGAASFSIIIPHVNITEGPGTSPALQALTPAGTTRDIGELGFLMSSYTAMPISPNWFLGLAITGPYGLTFNQGGPPWAAQQLGNRAHIFSVDFNPVIGWKINDVISVAAGPRATWVDANFNRSIFPLGGILGSPVELQANDWGFGFTAGVTVTPTPWTELSLGYRSQVHLNLDGQNFFPASPTLLVSPLTAPFFNTINNVTSSETLPDQVNFGARQRVSDTFTLLGTVEWTHWGILQSVPFTYTSGPAPAANAGTINFNFRDGWFFSVGGEYQFTERAILRTGIGYEISPVTDQFRDVNLPDRNRWWFSAGMSLKMATWLTLDFGYTYIWSDTAAINVGPGHPDQPNLITLIPGVFNTFQGTSDAQAHIISVGLRYKLIPEAVVTKY